MDVLERLEFELAYYDVVIQHVRNNTTKTTPTTDNIKTTNLQVLSLLY